MLVVVLNDGETFTALEGCTIRKVVDEEDLNSGSNPNESNTIVIAHLKEEERFSGVPWDWD